MRAHVGDESRFGVQVTYSQEDPAHLLGTGGALVHVLPYLDAGFLVMYGGAADMEEGDAHHRHRGFRIRGRRR